MTSAAPTPDSAARPPADEDEDDSIWGPDDDDRGYSYVRRSTPGWAMSKWLIVAAVAAAFVVLSFVMVPRIFTPEEEVAATSAPLPAAVAPTGEAPAAVSYRDAVLASGPAHLWEFAYGEDPGLDALATSNLTLGDDIAVLGSTAVEGGAGALDCSGTYGSVVNSQTPETLAGDVSVEVWVNTTTGGQVLSFGSSAEGASGKVDRTVFVSGDGKVHFGVRGAKRYVVSSESSVSDGIWHHVVGTMSTASGLSLYIDGQLVATEPKGNQVSEFEGFWRICGDSLSGWPKADGKAAYVGSVDEVAVYNKTLSADEVQQHYAAS